MSRNTSFASRLANGDHIAKRYTVEHESVSFDDATGLGVITITDHAQEALGDVVFVELPTIGTEVKQGGELGLPPRSPSFRVILLICRANWCGRKCEGCFGYRMLTTSHPLITLLITLTLLVRSGFGHH